MTFNELSLAPNLLKAISTSGYTQPTPVQISAIPIILQGKDLIATAQTGTGKTAAFMLPALNHLAKHKITTKSHKPRILVLTPTRELAHQILVAGKKYGKFLNFNMSSIIGGVSYKQQLSALSRSPDLIIATPGRLLDHMKSKKLDLSAIEMLILDEADRMLDMGFIDDIKKIIKTTPSARQTLLFSATLERSVEKLAQEILKKPEQVRLAKQQTKASIEQRVYPVKDNFHKGTLLKELIEKEHIFKAIIFAATREGTSRLAEQLTHDGYQAAGLHGDLKQNQRSKVLEKLRNHKIQFLVATDVAARGIDVADITHVINYDFPRSAEDYVHRIGRTGRAGKTGIAISFVLAKEIRKVKQVEVYSNQTLLDPKDRKAAHDANNQNKDRKHKKNFRHAKRSESPKNKFARTGKAKIERPATRNKRSAKPIKKARQ